MLPASICTKACGLIWTYFQEWNMVLGTLNLNLSLNYEDLCLEMEYDTDNKQADISRFAKNIERMAWEPKPNHYSTRTRLRNFFAHMRASHAS